MRVCPACVPGLLVIGPLQDFGGWKAVWYFLVASTIAGMALLAPLVHKEIYNHEDVSQRRKNEPSAAATAFWPASDKTRALPLLCSF